MIANINWIELEYYGVSPCEHSIVAKEDMIVHDMLLDLTFRTPEQVRENAERECIEARLYRSVHGRGRWFQQA